MVAPPPDNDVLFARALRHSLDGSPALLGASVSVRGGEILAVAGPRGSGKTTLMRCLSGQIVPDEGEVWFNSSPVHTLAASAREQLRRDRFGWGDLTIVEAEPPRRIVARGRSGRFNRIRTVYDWTLTPNATGTATDVAVSVQRDAAAPFDRFRDVFGGRWADKRRWRRALGRLEAIVERGEGRGERATLSGGPRKPATGSPLR